MESDEKLSLDPVPSAEFVGPTLSHIAAADDCGPSANLFQVFGKNHRPFDRYERIRSSIILDAKGGKERSGEVPTLHGISACIEHDVPVVGHKPNWSDVWPPIGSGGAERPRASWLKREKAIHFVVSHQMVGHQPVLARGRSHVSLPRTRATQAPNDWPTHAEVSHPPGELGSLHGDDARAFWGTLRTWIRRVDPEWADRRVRFGGRISAARVSKRPAVRTLKCGSVVRPSWAPSPTAYNCLSGHPSVHSEVQGGIVNRDPGPADWSVLPMNTGSTSGICPETRRRPVWW